jgi:hypothetical protein
VAAAVGARPPDAGATVGVLSALAPATWLVGVSTGVEFSLGTVVTGVEFWVVSVVVVSVVVV